MSMLAFAERDHDPCLAKATALVRQNEGSLACRGVLWLRKPTGQIMVEEGIAQSNSWDTQQRGC